AEVIGYVRIVERTVLGQNVVEDMVRNGYEAGRKHWNVVKLYVGPYVRSGKDCVLVGGRQALAVLHQALQMLGLKKSPHVPSTPQSPARVPVDPIAVLPPASDIAQIVAPDKAPSPPQ